MPVSLLFNTKSHVQVTYLASGMVHSYFFYCADYVKNMEAVLNNLALLCFTNCIWIDSRSYIISAVGQWNVWSSYWSEELTQTTRTSLAVPRSIWQQEMGSVFLLKLIHYCHLLATVDSLCRPHFAARLQDFPDPAHYLSANEQCKLNMIQMMGIQDYFSPHLI